MTTDPVGHKLGPDHSLPGLGLGAGTLRTRPCPLRLRPASPPAEWGPHGSLSISASGPQMPAVGLRSTSSCAGVWGRLGAPGPRDATVDQPLAKCPSSLTEDGLPRVQTGPLFIHSFMHWATGTCSVPNAAPGPAHAQPLLARSRSDPTPLPGPSSHLSGVPGSRSRRRHLLAEWISCSFTRMSRCRARHQSWATVMLRF